MHVSQHTLPHTLCICLALKALPTPRSRSSSLWVALLPRRQLCSPSAPVSHLLYNVATHTFQGSNISSCGGNNIAGLDAPVPLQRGHRKHSHSYRNLPAHTPAPESKLVLDKVHEPQDGVGRCGKDDVSIRRRWSQRQGGHTLAPLVHKSLLLTIPSVMIITTCVYCHRSLLVLVTCSSMTQLHFFGLTQHIKHVFFHASSDIHPSH